MAKLHNELSVIADQFERCLADEWHNDAGKWINRIKELPDKCLEVLQQVETAKQEHRIRTTPARYAEFLWQRPKI